MKPDLHPAICDWLEAEEAGAPPARVDKARSIAHSIPLPTSLRPAMIEDIVEGAIIWYPPAAERTFHVWALVKAVLRADGEFKGFISHHPMRLDLEGAYVELKEGH